MKRYAKLFGIMALAAIIGFSFAACSGGLNGTWFDSESGVKWVFKNGNFTMWMDGYLWDNVEILKGTYTTSGSDLTTTITHISGNLFGDMGSLIGFSKSQWYTPQEYEEIMNESFMPRFAVEAMLRGFMGDGEMFGSSTGAYSINGKTLTLKDGRNAADYIRQ
jgi:hypothetical protein